MTREINSNEGTGSSQGWEAYFDPDEHLIWEGSPVSGIHISFGGIFLSVFGLPFLAVGLGVAVAGLAQISQLNIMDFGAFSGMFFVLFSVPFMAIGGGLVFGPWLKGPIAARRVRYALSNRRAYIAKSYWGRNIESYVILPDSPIEFDQGMRTDTINFQWKTGRDSDGDLSTKTIGFENIADGKEVYRMIRKIQRDLQ